MHSLLSIIIPTYNYGFHIADAMESVLAQHDAEFELLIIDDGSTDNTETVVRPYVKKYPSFIRYIKKNNGGPGSARNLGAREAKGNYFIFLDADDTLLKNAFVIFRQALKKNPHVDFIAAGHSSIDDKKHIKLHPFIKPLYPQAEQNFIGYLRKEFSLTPGSCLFHRRIFNKLHYPENVRSSEDLSVFAQTLALYQCISIPEPVVLMYKHPDSLRHHFDYQKAAGTHIVDLIFDRSLLPDRFFKFRQEYLGIRLLSLFRNAYFNKEYRAAKTYYWQALKAYPNAVLKLPYLRKYLRCVFA